MFFILVVIGIAVFRFSLHDKSRQIEVALKKHPGHKANDHGDHGDDKTGIAKGDDLSGWSAYIFKNRVDQTDKKIDQVITNFHNLIVR